MSNRGSPASVLHNVHKHYYIAVDTTTSNWKSYLYNKINKIEGGGILHVMDSYTHEEIERLMV